MIRAHKEWRVLKVVVVHKVYKVFKDLRVLVGRRERKVFKDQPTGRKVSRATKEIRERKAHKV